MIKAEDLRIGDLVIVNKIGCMAPKGTMCKVVAIDSEKSFEEMNLKGCATLIELEVNHCNISFGIWCKNISPIPLTPEIFEKNGFEVKRIGECYAKTIGLQKKYISRYISIERMHTEWKIFIKYTSLIDQGLLRSVKHVHELQHILWALGEDANLKR